MKGTEQITGERDSQMGSERDGAAVRWHHQGGVEVGGGVARIGGVCVRRFSVPWGKARLIIHLKAIPLSENQLR